MFKTLPKEKEWISWVFVFVWVLIIYATIPFVRSLQRTCLWNAKFAIPLTYTFILLILSGMCWQTIRSKHLKSWINALVLILISGIYVYFIKTQLVAPDEALHFIEYGVLGLLLYRALLHRTQDISVYIIALLLGLTVGTIDEIIQWLTPKRYWDYRDVWMNGLGVGLMQAAIAFGLSPAIISKKIKISSLPKICHAANLFLFIFLYCVSNTPDFINRVVNIVPGFDFMKHTTNIMTEYGYKHYDQKIGIFFSRFPLEKIREIDRKRSNELADILNQYMGNKEYSDFLKKYTTFTDPFVHEIRVHLYRRDYYVRIMQEPDTEEKEKRRTATIAYRENQILEEYFSNTLINSEFKLSTEIKDMLIKYIEPNKKYTSPVSKDIITFINQKTAQLICFSLILIFFLCQSVVKLS